ncbi:deoxyribonuclease gamma-like [Clytia hemisphaerica]|uniref:Deoxyribonuclease n=1 Tax=Clytia hemisphaerica TaxID=252671 RepID=A0A7M5WXI9_9CNID
MSAFTALVLLLALSSYSTTSTSTPAQLSANDDSVLDIAAFNVRIFGANKATDQTTMDILVKIILRYDLILIQEIRDSSGTAIQTLLKTLNKELKVPGASYKMKLSPRLGRTASKEEYAYIFRSDLLTCIDSFTFNDHFDVFEREPYVVRFKSDLAAIKEFAVAGIHTSPRDATNEVSNLTKVYDAIQQKWRLDNVIIMGDFNAGCDFVKEWRAIGLAKDPRFYWIIDHSKDTTTGHSDCPYDRIVVAGRDLVKNVIPLSGDVFYFDHEHINDWTSISFVFL